MPVYDQGYREFLGVRRRRSAILVIARACFRASIRWPFFIVLIVGVFPLMRWLFEAYATGAGSAIFPMFQTRWGFGDGLFYELISTEIFMVVMLLSVTGSGQIANDLRSGALQIYFSRPIRQRDYVLGKLGTVVFTGLLLTLAPGILLLLACAAFAPDFSFLTGNPLLPLKILGFSLIISITLGSVVLALSSLAKQGRMVGLTFAGGYFFTMVLGKVLPRVFSDSRLEVVHLGKCLDAAGRTLFTDGSTPSAPAELAWGILFTLVLLSLIQLTRKVDAVEVVS